MRALALRDLILRRTGYIETPPDASPPATVAPSPPLVPPTAAAGAFSRCLATPAQPMQ
jgi:hypothetical protein